MGATLLTQTVADTITKGDHGSTFAANCLVTAVAQVVFRRISNPAFLKSVKERGEYLGAALRKIQGRHPELVKEVRGRGLIWGVEVSMKALDVVNAGYEHGIIVTIAGDNIIRLVPPLIVEQSHIDELAAKLEEALQATAPEEQAK